MRKRASGGVTEACKAIRNRVNRRARRLSFFCGFESLTRQKADEVQNANKPRPWWRYTKSAPLVQGGKRVSLPWFRLYHRIIDDEKMRLLAFEDRWHFVAILCLKADGLLDEQRTPLWERKVAVKLGIQARELDEVSRRLQEVGLIDGALNPVAWDELQYKSDNSTARVKAFREKQRNQGGNSVKRFRNVSVTAQDTDTDTDEEKKDTPLPPKGVQKPDDVSDEVWQDFKRHRARHGGISDRVIAGFRREAAKAGWSLEQAMDESITQGWRGFKAEYVKNRQDPSRGASLAEIGEEVRRLYEH